MGEMVTINADLLSMDAKEAAKNRNSTFTKITVSNDLPSSCIANSKSRYIKECEKMECPPTETNIEFGYMDIDRLKKICGLFGLDAGKYIVASEHEEQENVEQAPAEDVLKCLCGHLEKLTEAVESIGKIEMQNMEYLKKLCEAWDK
ncbi:MAG: hypothetical protein IJZ23_07030 [Roseburia sp.]|nr:hypothetical protein [Roseburia sp.]MBQ8279578.1 hypothetical protein [Roseburia sp.]